MSENVDKKQPFSFLPTSIEENLLMVGEIFKLVTQTLWGTISRPFYLNRVIEQIKVLGWGSLSITFVIGLTMGLVMTLNFGYGLKSLGVSSTSQLLFLFR